MVSTNGSFGSVICLVRTRKVVSLLQGAIWSDTKNANPPKKNYQRFRYASISFIPPYEFDPTIAVKVAPLTVIYVFMLAFNNLCLKYVEVTFYQLARSFSINFTILFTYVILRQKTSSSALFACFIVFMGFAIGSYGEMNFSWAGIIYGIGSSAFVGLYSIYVKKSLPIVGNNQYRLLHYNTTLAILILGPIVLLSDEPNMIWDNVAFLDSASFWALMTFTGITGFGITVSIFLQVKYTSALTNTISGTAKSCLQSILAAIVFKNTIAPTVRIMIQYGLLNVIHNCVCLTVSIRMLLALR
jgi:GDP-fucose transporter C1